MSAARRALIPAIALSSLFLSVSARAQIRPSLRADSLQPDSNDMPALPQRMNLPSPLQPISKNPNVEQVRPHLGKAFWLGWALAGAFSVASVEMTVRCERVPGCSEGNPLFGRTPGRLELYAPRAAIVTAGMLLCRHWKRRNPKDDTPTITVSAVDAIWGADTVWDARRLAAVRKPPEPEQMLAGSN